MKHPESRSADLFLAMRQIGSCWRYSDVEPNLADFEAIGTRQRNDNQQVQRLRTLEGKTFPSITVNSGFATNQRPDQRGPHRMSYTPRCEDAVYIRYRLLVDLWRQLHSLQTYNSYAYQTLKCTSASQQPSWVSLASLAQYQLKTAELAAVHGNNAWTAQSLILRPCGRSRDEEEGCTI